MSPSPSRKKTHQIFKRKGGGAKAFWTMLKKNAELLNWYIPYLSCSILSHISSVILVLGAPWHAMVRASMACRAMARNWNSNFISFLIIWFDFYFNFNFNFMAWYGEPPVWHVERRQGMAFRPITNRRMVSQALNCSSLRTESRVDGSGEIEKLLRVDFRPRWGSKSWRLGLQRRAGATAGSRGTIGEPLAARNP